VAWEERNGRLYYYQSERDETGKVRKRYVGSGEELEHMRSLMSQVLELDEAVEAVVRAHLTCAGFHRHKGEWRRGRKKT
jgi:hypothetical protein